MDENAHKTALAHASAEHRAGPFGATARATRDRMVRLAYRFLWNRDDAEDVAHEAWATALTKSGQLRESDKWWPWLSTIVVRLCFVHGRRKKLHRRHGDAMAATVAVTNDWEWPTETAELRGIVRGLLQELPRRQKEVLVLRHFEEMPFDEIGKVLSMAPATARVHAQQGRERLLELLSLRHPDWIDEAS